MGDRGREPATGRRRFSSAPLAFAVLLLAPVITALVWCSVDGLFMAPAWGEKFDSPGER